MSYYFDVDPEDYRPASRRNSTSIGYAEDDNSDSEDDMQRRIDDFEREIQQPRLADSVDERRSQTLLSLSEVRVVLCILGCTILDFSSIFVLYFNISLARTTAATAMRTCKGELTISSVRYSNRDYRIVSTNDVIKRYFLVGGTCCVVLFLSLLVLLITQPFVFCLGIVLATPRTTACSDSEEVMQRRFDYFKREIQ